MGFIDLSKNKYGLLEVIKLSHSKKNKNGKNTYYWLCKCECGNEVVKSTDYLKRSNLCSCGCASNRTKQNQSRID